MLELQDASEEAAALAVLQSLYAVAPLGQLLAKLPQEQRLQAAMLADKWQVPDVSRAAVRAIPAHALTKKLLQDFVQLPAVPNFLLPLLGPVASTCISASGAGTGMTEDAKQLLLSVLGDLEAVLGDAALREALLALPPRVMKLLLSCDDLKVRVAGCQLSVTLVIPLSGLYRCLADASSWPACFTACVPCLQQEQHLSPPLANCRKPSACIPLPHPGCRAGCL